MRAIAAVLFLGGLLLAVRVMFFGVRRELPDDERALRAWPLGLAAFLGILGTFLYGRPAVGAPAIASAVGVSVAVAGLAWWLVKRSGAKPSTDPEDDPRYKFQGHVARVIQPFV